jgi:GxxExxY protein
VYENAMLIALRESSISVQYKLPIEVSFRRQVVGTFEGDLLVENAVLLELKSARAIDSAHEALLLNYLRATNVEVGLVLNFGPKPEFRRLAYDNARKGQRGTPPSNPPR